MRSAQFVIETPESSTQAQLKSFQRIPDCYALSLHVHTQTVLNTGSFYIQRMQKLEKFLLGKFSSSVTTAEKVAAVSNCVIPLRSWKRVLHCYLWLRLGVVTKYVISNLPLEFDFSKETHFLNVSLPAVCLGVIFFHRRTSLISSCGKGALTPHLPSSACLQEQGQLELAKQQNQCFPCQRGQLYGQEWPKCQKDLSRV